MSVNTNIWLQHVTSCHVRGSTVLGGIRTTRASIDISFEQINHSYVNVMCSNYVQPGIRTYNPWIARLATQPLDHLGSKTELLKILMLCNYSNRSKALEIAYLYFYNFF